MVISLLSLVLKVENGKDKNKMYGILCFFHIHAHKNTLLTGLSGKKGDVKVVSLFRNFKIINFRIISNSNKNYCI